MLAAAVPDMPRCHLCRTPQECECARVASIPGLPVALPVWYWLPRAEREGTHHVQSSRAFELRSPPSSGSTSLSIVTRAPCHFFRFHFLVFSVLFSFIIVCAAAPAGGRGLISFKKWADYTFISVFTLMTFYLV